MATAIEGRVLFWYDPKALKRLNFQSIQMTKMPRYEVPVLMKPLLPDDIKDKVIVNLEKLGQEAPSLCYQ
jgi:hypothetical protein